jgi:hypothetical protein
MDDEEVMNGESDSDDSLLSESSREKTNRSLLLLLALHAVINNKRKRRAPNIERNRACHNAEEYIRISESEGKFLQEYGVSLTGFRKLADLLRDDLAPKRRARHSSLDVESKLLLTLRLLRGGSFWDIIRKHGIGETTLRDNFEETLDAIARHPCIGVPKWPSTKEECNLYANEWAIW